MMLILYKRGIFIQNCPDSPFVECNWPTSWVKKQFFYVKYGA